MDLYEKIREIICKESVNPLLQKSASFHREGGWKTNAVLCLAPHKEVR
jgi:hypothetical protein